MTLALIVVGSLVLAPFVAALAVYSTAGVSRQYRRGRAESRLIHRADAEVAAMLRSGNLPGVDRHGHPLDPGWLVYGDSDVSAAAVYRGDDPEPVRVYSRRLGWYGHAPEGGTRG